jgi:hypothetical protein
MGTGNSPAAVKFTGNHGDEFNRIFSQIEVLRRNADPEQLDEYRVAIEAAFASLKQCTIEIAEAGNVGGMLALGELKQKLGDLSWEYGYHETDEVFFAARLKHFAADDEAVRAALGSAVSDELCLKLFASALMAGSARIFTSALNSQGTRELTLELLVEGFRLLKPEGNNMHSAMLSGAFSWISAYLDTPGRLPRVIDVVASNMPIFEPHLRSMIEKSSYRSPDPAGATQTSLDLNMAMRAAFWVGLYTATENPVVLEAAEAWMAYPLNHDHFAQLEQIGLVKPQSWHDDWQKRSDPRFREYFLGHAIRTPGVELSVEFDHGKFDRELAAAVISTLEKARPTSPQAEEKIKKLFDSLVDQMALFEEKGDRWLDHQVAASSIPHEMIAGSMKMRRDRFMRELGI